ncbi:MAG: hypothetical protein PWP70_831 [Moorella sp. (in: firmicutes)]|nr:hypothetical protein [Moorella sp. (in: firmicutes)]
MLNLSKLLIIDVAETEKLHYKVRGWSIQAEGDLVRAQPAPEGNLPHSRYSFSSSKHHF